jgi:hypothetical protein
MVVPSRSSYCVKRDTKLKNTVFDSGAYLGRGSNIFGAGCELQLAANSKFCEIVGEVAAAGTSGYPQHRGSTSQPTLFELIRLIRALGQQPTEVKDLLSAAGNRAVIFSSSFCPLLDRLEVSQPNQFE